MARSNSHLYFAATVALQTASLFGYAVGYIGGCLVLPSFQHHFHLSDLPPTALAAVQARLVLCWIVGAALGVPVGIPVCQRFGRRACLSLSAVAFVVGATLQVIDYDGTGQLALFETGRFLNGLGVGTGSLVAPMYIAETSTSQQRAVLMSAYQLFVQVFALAGFWSAYASHAVFPETSVWQWRIPVALQLVPGVVLFVGTFFIPESPRFSAEQGRWDEAEETLSWLRSIPRGDPELEEEMREVKSTMAARAAMEELRRESFWSEVCKKDVRRRLHVGVGLMVAQNIVGLNAINYAPVIFMSAGFTSVSSSLFLSGLFGVVKLISALVFMFYSVKVKGNRFWLKLGASVCTFSMLALGFCISRLSKASHTNNLLASTDNAMSILVSSPSEHSPEGALTTNGVISVLMVYLFTLAFGLSLGPISWNVCSEIFPLHINTRCCAITTCTQWIFQIVVATITPLLIAKTGWVTYIFYGCCCAVVLAWVTFVVPETRGVKVGREMDEVFGISESADGREDGMLVSESAPLLQNEHRRTSVVSYT